MSELRRIEVATHEEIIPGDFVRLASGGPLGLVSAVEGEIANVSWLNGQGWRAVLPWVCLRLVR